MYADDVKLAYSPTNSHFRAYSQHLTATIVANSAVLSLTFSNIDKRCFHRANAFDAFHNSFFNCVLLLTAASPTHI